MWKNSEVWGQKDQLGVNDQLVGAPDQRGLSDLTKFLLNSDLGEGSLLSVHVCVQGVSALWRISPRAPVSMGQRLQPVQVCDHQRRASQTSR